MLIAVTTKLRFVEFGTCSIVCDCGVRCSVVVVEYPFSNMDGHRCVCINTCESLPGSFQSVGQSHAAGSSSPQSHIYACDIVHFKGHMATFGHENWLNMAIVAL